MSKELARDRCSKGASYLDNRIPDWYRHIDLGDLEMDSCSFCILGQLGHKLHSTGYSGMMAKIDLGRDEDTLIGFDVDRSKWDCEFEELAAAWIEEITKRLEKDHHEKETEEGSNPQRTGEGGEIVHTAP